MGLLGSRSTAAWRPYAAVGLLAVVVHEALPAVADVVYLVIGVAAVVAVTIGPVLHGPRRSGPWRLFALGLGLWVVGDLVGTLPVGGGPAGELAVELAYLAGYPVLALGLLGLVRAGERRRDLAGVLDAATVAAAMTVMAWLFLVTPALGESGPGLGGSGFGLAFLAGDIVLVGGLVRVGISATARSRATWLLLAALGLVVVGDVLDLATVLVTGANPGWIDPLCLLSYLAWGSAALHPSMTGLTEPRAPRTFSVRLRLVVAGTCACLPVLGVTAQQAVGIEPDVVAALVATMVISGLLMGRQQLAFDRINEVTAQTLELRDQLAYEATHDSLTLLANRAHGLDLLDQALARSRAGGGTVTVMFLDLDGFKLVNDTLGHRAGDQLLRRVAERLTHSVRGSDVAVRLGGDEFVLVMESIDDAETALQVATRVIRAISAPVHLGPQGSAKVGASVGVAQSPDGSSDAATLLDEADVAAYRAKLGGKGRAELFDGALREHVLERERTATELQVAIAQDQLELDYQPVVDSLTGEVRGYEALVRWQHPTRGRLLPADFLPVAESSELVCELDRWVLHRATAQMRQWVGDGTVDGPVVAVNISTVTAARTRLVTDVSDALGASGLPAHRLVLELPERVLDDLARTVEHLRRVRELGVSVSVTDFGSAVGALARMADLPVNVVKIGRAALDSASPLGDGLLRLMIQAAHAVGLHAVAEGVEHDGQLATLRMLDCEMVQGHHIAEPMPSDDVPAYQQSIADRFSGLLP